MLCLSQAIRGRGLEPWALQSHLVGAPLSDVESWELHSSGMRCTVWGRPAWSCPPGSTPSPRCGGGGGLVLATPINQPLLCLSLVSPAQRMAPPLAQPLRFKSPTSIPIPTSPHLLQDTLESKPLRVFSWLSLAPLPRVPRLSLASLQSVFHTTVSREAVEKELPIFPTGDTDIQLKDCISSFCLWQTCDHVTSSTYGEVDPSIVRSLEKAL